MDSDAAPRSVRRRVELTPVDETMDASHEIVMAPKKRRPTSFVHFLRTPTEPEEYEWLMSDGRIGGYVFVKEIQCVLLYTLDSEGMIFTDQQPYISFCLHDWRMFRNKVWRDLNYPGLCANYSTVFDSVIHQKSYYIFAKQLDKDPADYIYFCSPSYRIVNGIHDHKPEQLVEDLKVVYPRADVPVLNNIFKKIDRLFKWGEHLFKYTLLKKRLFQSWPDKERVVSGLDAPVIYRGPGVVAPRGEQSETAMFKTCQNPVWRAPLSESENTNDDMDCVTKLFGQMSLASDDDDDSARTAGDKPFYINSDDQGPTKFLGVACDTWYPQTPP